MLFCRNGEAGKGREGEGHGNGGKAERQGNETQRGGGSQYQNNFMISTLNSNAHIYKTVFRRKLKTIKSSENQNSTHFFLAKFVIEGESYMVLCIPLANLRVTHLVLPQH